MKKNAVRILKGLCVVVVLSMLVVNLGVAHPALSNFGGDSIPAPGSIVKLSELHDQIKLVFSEEIDSERSTMILIRNQGAVYADMGDATVDLSVADRNVMTLTVDKSAIEPGTYTVQYIAISPDDHGVTVGSYNFAVVAD